MSFWSAILLPYDIKNLKSFNSKEYIIDVPQMAELNKFKISMQQWKEPQRMQSFSYKMN
jgi:hypothetical protein